MVLYEGTGEMFQAVWSPVLPEKAIPGMPSFEAAVAAPTVPDNQTAAPRFAVVLLGLGADCEWLLGFVTSDVGACYGYVWVCSKVGL